MAEVTELRDKKEKIEDSPKKKNREFSKMDRILLAGTGLVSFGGLLFCFIIIVLMKSITY